MQDTFTGQPTALQGRKLPDPKTRCNLQYDHRRRLEALDRLGAAAAQCGLRTDSDRDLVLLAEDEVSLLESTGPDWASLGAAIRDFRRLIPILRLELFGFNAAVESPLEEENPQLWRIGGGVEAWAYADAHGSVYKLYLPREGKQIGSTFFFDPGAEPLLRAEAVSGDYADLLEKILLIDALNGMPTEVVAVTPEGILIAKQTLGEPLPQGTDTSPYLAPELIEIPSRYLRADRDHPRLFFHEGKPWLVADLHARNLVRDGDGRLRVIDLVAAPWPSEISARNPLLCDWLTRVAHDPHSGVFDAVDDDEL